LTGCLRERKRDIARFEELGRQRGFERVDSNIESCSLAEDAPGPHVGGVDVQTSYESWSAGSMKRLAD